MASQTKTAGTIQTVSGGTPYEQSWSPLTASTYQTVDSVLGSANAYRVQSGPTRFYGINTNQLLLTNFGFSLPGGDNLVSGNLALTRFANLSGGTLPAGANIIDLSVYLWNGSAITGPNLALGGYWEITDTTVTYVLDLSSVSVTTVNNSGFGIQIVAQGQGGPLGPFIAPDTIPIASVDAAIMTITTVTPGASGTVVIPPRRLPMVGGVKHG
jgi:hypothetical protein